MINKIQQPYTHQKQNSIPFRKVGTPKISSVNVICEYPMNQASQEVNNDQDRLDYFFECSKNFLQEDKKPPSHANETLGRGSQNVKIHDFLESNRLDLDHFRADTIQQTLQSPINIKIPINHQLIGGGREPNMSYRGKQMDTERSNKSADAKCSQRYTQRESIIINPTKQKGKSSPSPSLSRNYQFQMLTETLQLTDQQHKKKVIKLQGVISKLQKTCSQRKEIMGQLYDIMQQQKDAQLEGTQKDMIIICEQLQGRFKTILENILTELDNKDKKIIQIQTKLCLLRYNSKQNRNQSRNSVINELDNKQKKLEQMVKSRINPGELEELKNILNFVKQERLSLLQNSYNSQQGEQRRSENKENSFIHESHEKNFHQLNIMLTEKNKENIELQKQIDMFLLNISQLNQNINDQNERINHQTNKKQLNYQSNTNDQSFNSEYSLQLSMDNQIKQFKKEQASWNEEKDALVLEWEQKAHVQQMINNQSEAKVFDLKSQVQDLLYRQKNYDDYLQKYLVVQKENNDNQQQIQQMESQIANLITKDQTHDQLNLDFRDKFEQQIMQANKEIENMNLVLLKKEEDILQCRKSSSDLTSKLKLNNLELALQNERIKLDLQTYSYELLNSQNQLAAAKSITTSIENKLAQQFLSLQQVEQQNNSNMDVIQYLTNQIQSMDIQTSLLVDSLKEKDIIIQLSKEQQLKSKLQGVDGMENIQLQSSVDLLNLTSQDDYLSLQSNLMKNQQEINQKFCVFDDFSNSECQRLQKNVQQFDLSLDKQIPSEDLDILTISIDTKQQTTLASHLQSQDEISDQLFPELSSRSSIASQQNYDLGDIKKALKVMKKENQKAHIKIIEQDSELKLQQQIVDKLNLDNHMLTTNVDDLTLKFVNSQYGAKLEHLESLLNQLFHAITQGKRNDINLYFETIISLTGVAGKEQILNKFAQLVDQKKSILGIFGSI